MTMKKKTILLAAAVLMVSQLWLPPGAGAETVMVDSQVLEQLQRLVADQQKQLDKLQSQIDSFQATAIKAEAQAREAKVAADEAKTSAETPAGNMVASGNERVKLAVSGQINRAVNLIDDGDETALYFVDNEASNSRVRFVGTVKVDEDLTIGSRLETALAPNESTTVSQISGQDDRDDNDFIDLRYAEVSLAGSRFGKLYFGKGDTASNNTAEVDLSGTDVVQYAKIGDIADAMLFRESAGNELTEVRVGNVFNDFDGLSRRSRVRYDLPAFHGFTLAGSVISDSRWDTALTWSGSGYGLKAGAAAAVAALNTATSENQYDGSFSVLHESTGLNFTFSAGTRDGDSGDDPYNLWGKVGWLTDFCPLGKTAFALDYAHTGNLPAEGDEGDSVGLAVVQNFAEYGTELYLQFRQYALERQTGADVSDINMGTIGARVKF